jgi:hypothetical protein
VSTSNANAGLLRSASLFEGVRLAGPCAVRGITMSPIVPGLGRDVASLVNHMLEQHTFNTIIPSPAWMASYGTRHPLLAVITPPGRFPESADAWLQINALVRGAVDVLAIREGGAPRLVGSVIERHDGSRWKTLTVIVGGAPWSMSHLSRATSDNGAVVPQLDCDEAASYIIGVPRVALWLHIFTSILSEGDINIRALRIYGLLEAIAAGAPRGVVVRELDGTQLHTRNNASLTTDSRAGKLVFLILSAFKELNLSSGVLFASSGADISSELDIWKNIRDVIAHEGVWLPTPHATRLRDQQQAIEQAARLAANGDRLEQGFEKYVGRMIAGCEAVVRCLLAGRLLTFL